MKYLKSFLMPLLCTLCMGMLSACGGDEPKSESLNSGIEVTKDDPEGTIGLNLVRGSYSADNSIKLTSGQPGYTGAVNLYITGQDNFALRSDIPGQVAEIRDLGRVNMLKDITEIPNTIGWTVQCATQIFHGYIVRFKIVNETTGDEGWEYCRLRVTGYYGEGNSIKGYGVKYQPHWQYSK